MSETLDRLQSRNSYLLDGKNIALELDEEPLTRLIARLEAATSRLEDMASSAASFEGEGGAANGVSQDSTTSGKGVPRAAAGVAAAGASPTPKPQQDLPPFIVDLDILIHGDVEDYAKLSNASAIGGLVGEQSRSVVTSFQALRHFLLITTKAKKPEDGAVYMETLQSLQERMGKVDDIRSNNRPSPQKDQLAMVADGISAMAWVTVDSKPHEYVNELFGGAQMYGNKVLKQFKDKYVGDEAQVEWVKSFYKVMRSLIAYIKQHHPQGVKWNANGVDAREALEQVSAVNGTSTTSSGPPPPPPLPSSGGPPPPPPPPPGLLPAPAAKKAPAADMGAVFADLNRGAAITSGLKKVDASQMTHKNPNLRTSAVVPERSNSGSSIGRSNSPGAPPGKKPKPESLRTKKPPKKELDGSKWIIENFETPSSPIEIQAEQNHSILITKCKGAIIRVNGKANAISIDNCTKTSMILDSLVSSLDVIKCPSFALQVIDTIPTVLLDQVDGAQIYLSKESLNTDIFTSKCSSINVNLPPETEDDDYKESPIPEQFRSFIKGGKLITEIVEHAG
ncbi:hypothetical protein EJ08DRAFT_580564 [Tothia fuscella]|uniref:Adenylyl cyclase-associated protein n=1 Tax=Tothia fuscella TaxID=1048955 RepID=A0A9P4U3F5_9PEZI|nr:hypothetical protein EJ08DRAFT_580564 [Tothia fuscella]